MPYDDSHRNLPAAVLAENLTVIAGLADCQLELAALLVHWCLLILTAALLAGFRPYSLVRKSSCDLLIYFFLRGLASRVYILSQKASGAFYLHY